MDDKMNQKNYLTFGLVAVILVSFIYAGSAFVDLTNSNRAQVSFIDDFEGAEEGGSVSETLSGGGGSSNRSLRTVKSEVKTTATEVSPDDRYILAFTKDKNNHVDAVKQAIASYPKVKIAHAYTNVINGFAVTGATKVEIDAIAKRVGADEVMVDAPTPKDSKYSYLVGKGKYLSDILAGIEFGAAVTVN